MYAKSGYCQVEIDERGCETTAFTSHQALYQFVQMPFGTEIAPTVFQRSKDVILSSVKWHLALVSLDDIVVSFKTVEQQRKHLQRFMTLLQDAGVTLKLNNCFFFAESINHRGHFIHPGKLKIAKSTTDDIGQFQQQTTRGKDRSFL